MASAGISTKTVNPFNFEKQELPQAYDIAQYKS